MKLLQRDRKELTAIYSTLHNGAAFLQKPDILVCRKERLATTTLHYQNKQGDVCYSIDKQVGSELCLIWTALNRLEKALFPEKELSK